MRTIIGFEDILSLAALEEIFVHCAAAYPEEACGFVCASGHVRRCRNIQTDLHTEDPSRHPRDARTGYTISFADALFLEESFAGADPVRVVFHSHPDVGAYLSDEDVEGATTDGTPILPVDHLVVATSLDGVEDARLYRFIGDALVEMACLDGTDDHKSHPTHKCFSE